MLAIRSVFLGLCVLPVALSVFFGSSTAAPAAEKSKDTPRSSEAVSSKSSSDDARSKAEAKRKAKAERRAPTRVVKVLPHFLDKEGRHTINPSLFDRDAYQHELQQRPELRSGMRFDVLWKSTPSMPAALTMKVELRGSKAPAIRPVIVTNRAFARGGFSQWTRVPILGKDYDALGELVAWRVSLWKDDQMIAEKKSFLW